ncbi:MAG: YCF48-related protein [Bacteroidota bacterium]
MKAKFLLVILWGIGTLSLNAQISTKTQQQALTQEKQPFFKHPLLRQSPASLQARSTALPPEDWMQVNAPQPNPWIFQQGFSYVSDSLIWASPIDIAPIVGVPGAPNKEISKTTDEGLTWEAVRIELPDSSLVLTRDSMLTPVVVEAVNDTLLWVGMALMPTQDSGALVKSIDGGETWDVVELPLEGRSIFPFSIHFFDTDTGVAFANGVPFAIPTPVTIFYTENGGETWSDVSPELDSAESRWFSQTQSLYDVQGDTIWYGTRFGRILRSINSGRDWEVFETGGGNVNSIAFKDALNGLAVVENGGDGFIIPSLTLRTEDGGETWTRTEAPAILENIFYVEGSGGVYIGSTGQTVKPGFLISKDDGNTWTYDIPTVAGAAFFFPRPDFGLMGDIGFVGSFYKYQGPPLLLDETQEESLQFEGQAGGVIPDGSTLFDIDAVDEEVILGVANENSAFTFPVRADHSPAIIKSVDGGETWTYIVAEEITGFISYDIFAFNQDTIWISAQNFDTIPGSPRALYASFDGGDTWEEKVSDIAAGVWVHFFDSHEGIVINADFILRTLDGGNTWNPLDSAALPPFDSTEFTGIYNGTNSLETQGDNLWFGTTLGRVYKSRDRGVTWEAIQVVPDSSAAISTLAFKDSLNGMAALDLPGFSFPFTLMIAQTSDGGNTWSLLPPFAARVSSLEYIPGTENSYMASGRFAQFAAYTNDGGNSWVYLPDVAEFDGIDFINPSTGWAANKTSESSFWDPILQYTGESFPAISVSNSSVLEDNGIEVYPNPVVDRLTVSSKELIHSIMLIDIQGRRLELAKQLHQNHWEGRLDTFSSGTYWLEISINGKTYFQLMEIK